MPPPWRTDKGKIQILCSELLFMHTPKGSANTRGSRQYRQRQLLSSYAWITRILLSVCRYRPCSWSPSDSAIARMPDRSTAHCLHLIAEPAPFEDASMRLRLAEEGCPLYRTRVT